jgi:hypothetical protein
MTPLLCREPGRGPRRAVRESRLETATGLGEVYQSIGNWTVYQRGTHTLGYDF